MKQRFDKRNEQIRPREIDRIRTSAETIVYIVGQSL